MMKFIILLVIGVIARQSYGGPPIAKRIAKPKPIVGGQDATIGQLKHQVSIYLGEDHYCGGTLISRTHVVTAAHCIPEKSLWGMFSVVAGTIDWRKGKRYKVKCVQPHPGFPKSFVVDHDIAVLTLKEPIEINERQAPIPLASRDYSNESGVPAIASGWGDTFYNSPVTYFLKWVQLKTVSISLCKKVHPVSNNQVCTYHSVGKGTCHGDSGGPLIANGEFIGVVSYGTPCAIGDPDVFTNIFKYRDYIKQCQEKCP